MKKILVTGAAGFIGFHIAKRFLAAGHRVIGVDDLNDYYDVNLKKARLASLKRNSRFHFIKMDIEGAEVMALKGAKELWASRTPPKMLIEDLEMVQDCTIKIDGDDAWRSTWARSTTAARRSCSQSTRWASRRMAR
jgi:NAD(P)-dependent dehydrogenase (short-subunit alcohol dehydrogenase family)